jgi:hypothetical protein
MPLQMLMWKRTYFPSVSALEGDGEVRVIVYAEDLSGRRDDGHYSKPDLASALDIFFAPDAGVSSIDVDGEHPLSRDDAETMFNDERMVTFYNVDGEKVVISADPTD